MMQKEISEGNRTEGDQCAESGGDFYSHKKYTRFGEQNQFTIECQVCWLALLTCGGRNPVERAAHLVGKGEGWQHERRRVRSEVAEEERQAVHLTGSFFFVRVAFSRIFPGSEPKWKMFAVSIAATSSGDTIGGRW